VVGVGGLGQHHARILRDLQGPAFAGFYDSNAARAEKVAGELGVAAHPTLDSLLDVVDAVTIVVPTPAHFEVARRVLGRGIHALIEKPIATTLEEADAMLALAREKGAIVQTGHVERFNRAIRAALPYVDAPRFIESDRLAPFNPRGSDVAVVLDLMIHDIDLARAIVGGEIVEHHAMGRPVLTEEPDFANALLRFDNGVLANITASRVSQSKIRRITLTQRDNAVVADLLRQQIEVHRIEHSEFLTDGGVRYRQSGLVEIPYLSEYGEPLMHELRHFVECVRERREPSVSGADGLAALRVCLGIRDSAGVR
jgi:UDP-N-acetylglucosamine 3-dehydrogenase